MGIPKFAKWIFQNRKRQLTTASIPSNVASLCFDVNSIIHGCAQIVYGYGESENDQRKQAIQNMSDQVLEQELFKLISDTILRIVERVNPKSFLVLAVDGVAPLAKINQQRQRRYRSASGVTEMRFDPNCITAGTDFMFRLDAYLQQWIQANIRILPERVLYSGHLVPGEGEQKIFDYVRSYEISGYGSHIIYGLDADLIILSLVSRLKGIYLLREKSLEQNVYERLIMIDEVRDYIGYRMRTNTAVDDFAVLTFFLGNDFLPTSPMFSGDMTETIEYMLDIYATMKIQLTYPKEAIIDTKNLYKIIRVFAEGETERLKSVYQNLPKNGFKTLEMSVEHLFMNNRLQVNLDKSEFRQNWYTKIFSPPLDNLDLAFEIPSDLYIKLFDATDSRIKDVVRNYISGILWTYYYYKKGTKDASPNYFYSLGYAPLMEDIHRHFPKTVEPYASKDILNDRYNLSVIKQMIAVLPPQSLRIVPFFLHDLYKVDSPVSDMFPMKVEVDVDGKDLDRLGIVRIPAVEPVRLYNLNIDLTSEMQEKYQVQENLMFVKEVRKTVDRMIKPNKITLEREVVQEGNNPVEEFLNLDVEASVRMELIQDMPFMQDIVEVKKKYPEEEITLKQSRPNFRSQFEKMRTLRGVT